MYDLQLCLFVLCSFQFSTKLILSKLQVDKTLDDLTKFNERLTKTVNQLAELRAWMMPTKEKLEFVTTTEELSPEDRVKEILDIQLQVRKYELSSYRVIELMS